MVKVGDSIPSIELEENGVGNKVNISSMKKGLIIGVPAAFSPGCSDTHLPEYIAHEKTKTAGDVYVIAVNDAFVVKAWAKTLDADASSGLHFMADAQGKFTEALDLSFDATPILGNVRSKRYALVIEDGKVKSVHVEPDNIGISESRADKVFG